MNSKLITSAAISLLVIASMTLSGCAASGDVPEVAQSSSEESASSGLVISDVHECGGDDGSTWYWAPCFSVNLDPFTKINCEVNALDADGGVVATMSGTFNTLNDGSTTGYGEGVGTQDVSEDVYKSIKSLDVSCQ